jgi:hypothetical protein
MRLKCEDGEFRTIQEINMLRQKIGMKPFSIKSQQGVAEAGNPAQQAAIAIAKKKKQSVSEAADNTAFRQGYERGIRYYRRGPQNPYQPGTLEHTDYNDGYQMGEADSYDKYDTSSMDENSR